MFDSAVIEIGGSSLNLPLLGTFIVSLYLFINVLAVLYNVTFHPLAKFPGPKLAGASPILLTYHKLRGRQHLWLLSLHNKYGPVVRYLPDTLSYIDPNAWEPIFGHRQNGEGDMPKDLENKMAFIGGNNSIMRMNDDDHSRVRRLLAPALSDKAIREQQEIIKNYVRMLVEHVETVAEEKGKIDMMRWYNFTTFDIIADLAFGESLGMLKQGEWTPWVYAINQSVPITLNVAAVSRYFPLLGFFLKFCIPASAYKSLHTHLEYSKNQVDKRIGRDTERLDFWKYILRNQTKDTGSLSPVENHALGQTLMVAGSETTAALLSGMTNQLLNNKDKYDRLAKEIRDAYSSLEEINVDNLAKLPYITACLKEGLRLYPPTPIGQQRVVPIGGRTVCDRFVPEGTLVTISHWSAYRYPEYWHKADEFIPERWLSESQSKGPHKNDRRQGMNAFSVGPRNCIGQNLAYHEARLIVSHLLWKFDFTLCDESRDWANQKVYGLAQRGELLAKPRLVAREDSNEKA